MKKVVGIITARMSSTRLPGKVMADMSGKSVFAHHAERIMRVKGLDAVYLATSKDSKNKPLVDEAKKLGLGVYRGSEEDILERHISIAEKEKADAVLRVTCDMPLFDFESASNFIKEYRRTPRDYIYVSNMTIIQGTVAELISTKALLSAHEVYRGPAITQPIKENMKSYKTLGVKIPAELCRPEYRLTLDYPEDLKVIRFIYDQLYNNEPVRLREVYKLLDDYPNVAKINRDVEIKGCERYSANLVDQPVYSIIKSGDKYVVLNENRSEISIKAFKKELDKIFPKK